MIRLDSTATIFLRFIIDVRRANLVLQLSHLVPGYEEREEIAENDQGNQREDGGCSEQEI